MKNYDSVFFKTNDIHIKKIIVLLIVSVITVLSMLNINTYMTDILNTQSEIEIKSKELQIKNIALENYNNNKALENKLKSEVLSIKKKINPYPAIQDDIINLDSILTQNNITATDFNIGNIEVLDYMTEAQAYNAVYYATIDITAHGNYYNILSAYSEITNSERWYDIKSVSFTSKEMQGDTIRLNTVFNIYFMEKTLPFSQKVETYNIYKNDNPFNY